MCNATKKEIVHLKPEPFIGQVSACGSGLPIGATRESFVLRHTPRDVIALFYHADLHTLVHDHFLRCNCHFRFVFLFVPHVGRWPHCVEGDVRPVSASVRCIDSHDYFHVAQPPSRLMPGRCHDTRWVVCPQIRGASKRVRVHVQRLKSPDNTR